MEYGSVNGTVVLEERALLSGARRLSGRFPYNSRATISDGGRSGGRPRKEEIASHAFRYRIENTSENLFLLGGHDYNRPLASRAAGTLKVSDSADAVTFEAMIDRETQDISWVADILRALDAGLIGGISPAFRLPPPRAVAKAEETYEEDPAEGTAIIRRIIEALLYEFSLVSVPAYPETSIESEERSAGGIILPKPHPLKRWRL
ncbi:HK97 family phage prohead protease [Roseibium aggregatum]|uniref:HK97 family phage prohead protease n=1 Tax=Roseibium aggregatum TaxID=187304 RepID=UPI001E637BD4|nr:HK97 family phage prohead protease [Roseibium aggregatum]